MSQYHNSEHRHSNNTANKNCTINKNVNKQKKKENTNITSSPDKKKEDLDEAKHHHKTPFRILKKYPKPQNPPSSGKKGFEIKNENHSKSVPTKLNLMDPTKVLDDESDSDDDSSTEDEGEDELETKFSSHVPKQNSHPQKKLHRRHIVKGSEPDVTKVTQKKKHTKHTRIPSTGSVGTADSSVFRSRKHIYERSDRVDGITSNFVSPSSTRLVWEDIPHSVLVILNKHNMDAIPYFKSLCIYLSRTKKCKVIIEEEVYNTSSIVSQAAGIKTLNVNDVHTFKEPNEKVILDSVDIAICMGGDGTVLHTVGLFQKACPPILGFAMGSIGFLTVFNIEKYKSVIDSVFNEHPRISTRSRLYIEIERADGSKEESYMVLNEVVCDRGPSPFLTTLDTYCSNRKITTVLADGLIIATPNGSSAYSMSAGGSIVHPSVPCILLTPICPHSLSFRPLILPDSSKLRICVPESARADAYVSFDGKVRRQLKKGDAINIQTSKYPVPLICKSDETHEWFKNLSQCFNWNIRTQQRSFS
mmetsp:Transcript_6973/g.10211  ORF Transcript_6973/g.10211 Transcript_6973/m.10211 type:complete len:531 (-) Transcript_6973:7-1599(-)